MLPLKSVINEIYPAEVSAKVRQAMDIKAQDGEFLHPYLPYGYGCFAVPCGIWELCL